MRYSQYKISHVHDVWRDYNSRGQWTVAETELRCVLKLVSIPWCYFIPRYIFKGNMNAIRTQQNDFDSPIGVHVAHWRCKSHTVCYLILQILLDAGSTIPESFKEFSSNTTDSLRQSVGQLEVFKGLASEAYVTLRYSDPVDKAFVLSDKLLRLSKVCVIDLYYPMNANWSVANIRELLFSYQLRRMIACPCGADPIKVHYGIWAKILIVLSSLKWFSYVIIS